MKKALALLLIAVLLLCPVLSAHAEGGEYVKTDQGFFDQEGLDRLNARAEEILQAHGVAVYFFYMSAATELIDYTRNFAETEVAQSDAIILGLNDTLYYFFAKGETAETVFSESAQDDLWEAFRSVKGDAEGKVRAYFDKADELLAAYAESTPESTESPAPVNGRPPRVFDRAELLTSQQRLDLIVKLNKISEAYRCDVVVATVQSLGTKTAEEFADDFFDYNGYGYDATPDANGTTVDGDGILLLLSMEDRDFAISTSGYGITAFTDYGILNYIEPSVLPYLRKNEYADAFDAFADRCEELLKLAREGRPYDCNRVYTRAGALTEAQWLDANEQIAQLLDRHNVALYFVYDPDETDLHSAVNRLLDERRILESNAVIFCANADRYIYRFIGSGADVFTEKDRLAVANEIMPLLNNNDCPAAVSTFISQSERILNRHPLNGFMVLLALAAGGLFAFIPVNSMRRQLTDVHQNRNADAYLIPASFQLKLNSDVLLGTRTSRSVHVVVDSGGGGRSGGGGSFHSGSTTHTSSSGGTHGGHSGKF